MYQNIRKKQKYMCLRSTEALMCDVEHKESNASNAFAGVDHFARDDQNDVRSFNR
jgi:hypothetical protein